MCPGWWQRLHFRVFLAVDPVSEELARGLLLLDSGPWVFPLLPGQGRAPKVPVRRVRGRLSLEGHTEVEGKYKLPQCVESILSTFM